MRSSKSLPQRSVITRYLLVVGRPMLVFLREMGGLALLAGETLRLSVMPPYEGELVAREVDEIGLRSLAVVGAAAFFVGMVLVVNATPTAQQYGTQYYVAPGVALVLFRELGPVLAGLIVAGRVGSGITAEIGSMTISEQIDAMRVLGANPVKRLVVPKFLGAAIALPLLAVAADVLGLLGGLLTAITTLQISASFYFSSIKQYVALRHFVIGVVKSPFFGMIIALVAAYEGLNTSGGTTGVGRSTTRTMVVSFLLILVADYVLSMLIVHLGALLK